MASIGQLAAGVAHEINNPIGYVHSNLGTLQEYISALFAMVACSDAALRSDDPAEDAYQLGLDLLEKQGSARPAAEAQKTADGAVVLDEKAGDRTDGRREVLETLSQNADRPRGIGSLPAAEGRVIRKLTSDDISKMSDAEYQRLPQHVRDAYLAGGPL